MRRSKIQDFEMVVRVDDFGIERAHLLPTGTLVSKIRESLGLVRTKLMHLLSQQVSDKLRFQSACKAKRAAAKVLTLRLEKIDRTARILGIDSIRWTSERTNQQLLNLARSFASHLVVFKEQFVLHGMPEGFIEDLNVVISDFEQAIKGIVDARTAGVATIREFDAVLDEALKLVDRFEDLVMNTVSDNRAVMTAWEAARRVIRPIKSKAKTATKTESKTESKPEPKPEAQSTAQPQADPPAATAASAT